MPEIREQTAGPKGNRKIFSVRNFNSLSHYICISMLIFSLNITAGIIKHLEFDGNSNCDTENKNGIIKGSYFFVKDRFENEGSAILLKKGHNINLGNSKKFSFTDGAKDLPFTVELWLKCETETGKYPQLTKEPFDVIWKAGEYYIGWSNTFRVRLLQDKQKYIGVFAGVRVNKGKWSHITVSYDGSGKAEGIKVYQNGEPLNTKPENSGLYNGMRTSKGSAFLGGRGAGAFDDLIIYNHAKSPDEIKDSYQSNFTSKDFAHSNRYKKRFEQNPIGKKLTVPKNDEKPVIDGKLNEDCWKHVRWYNMSVLNSDSEPDVTTKFALFHDNKFFYLAVVAEEPFTDKIKTNTLERDGHTYKDDVIEFFIDTGTGKNPRHYHWAINAKGAIFDEIATRGAAFCLTDWNSDIKSSVKILQDSWILEAGFPLSELTFSADAPEYWGFNIARSRKTLPNRKMYSFTQVKTFHDSDNFAAIKVQDMDTDLSGLEIQFKDAELCADAGQVKGILNFSLINNSVAAKEIKFILKIGEAAKRSIKSNSIKLPPGTMLYKVPVTLTKSGKRLLEMNLKDAESGKMLCNRKQMVDLTYEPLKVELLQPGYRNSIFSGQNINELIFAVKVSVSENEKSLYDVRFNLKNDTGIKLLDRYLKIKNGNNKFVVKLPHLNTGTYKMEMTLIHRSTGRTLRTWQEPLYKRPYFEGQVYLNQDGKCIVNGKPFFPYGLAADFRVKGIWDAVKMGCNTIEFWGYERLSAIRHSGLMLVAYPFYQGFEPPKNAYKYKGQITSEEKKKLTVHINKIKKFPGILCWYIANEPQSDIPTINRTKVCNSIICQEDPYHPTIAILDRAHLVALYRNDTAIMGVDPYPRYLSNGKCRRPGYTYEMVNRAVKDTDRKMPVWAMLQAYDTVVFGDENPDSRGAAPKFKDLRSQMYQAIIAGAKGIFWYERGYADIYPEIRYGIRHLAGEVELLKNVFFANNLPAGIELLTKVIPPKRKPAFCLRNVDGNHFVLVANLSNKPNDFSFRLTDCRASELFAVGEERKVLLKAGTFSDHFAPNEARAYSSSREIAEAISIPTLYKEIEKAKTPAYKSGNIFAQAKASVTTSWKVNMKWVGLSGYPQYMIDGIPYTSFIGSKGELGWISITFEKPYKLRKLLFDSNITSALIAIKEKDKWREIATVKAQKPDQRREIVTVAFPAVLTSEIKIKVLKRKKIFGLPDPSTQIWEIEAYNE